MQLKQRLPNVLTLTRLLAVPVLMILLLAESRITSFWAAVAFAVAAATDWLDGFLARRWQVVTVIGKFLDPLADKLLVMTALIMLIPLERVPAWAVVIILAREMMITGLRSVASSEGIIIAASPAGKYKTITQMVALVALLLHYKYYWFFGLQWEPLHWSMHTVGMVFFWPAVALTVWSGGEYLWRFGKVLYGKA